MTDTSKRGRPGLGDTPPAPSKPGRGNGAPARPLAKLLALRYVELVRGEGLVIGTLAYPLDLLLLWSVGGCLGGTLRGQLEERYR